MADFYLVFIAVILAGISARDQVLVAGLSIARRQSAMVLVMAVVASCATSGFAAWAATVVIPELGLRAQHFFAALGLALAGIESLVIVPRASPREPTHSLGATLAALVAIQLIDAARFVVFALAVATRSPVTAGVAGALAGSLVVTVGWAWPGLLGRRWLGWARRLVGVVLLIAGIVQATIALELL